MGKNVTSYEVHISGVRIIWCCPCCGNAHNGSWYPHTEVIVDIANGKLEPMRCYNCGELISFNECELM